MLEHINQYLLINTIKDKKYIATHVQREGENVKLLLKRVGDNLYNDGHIDEDFETDKAFTALCQTMAMKLEVKRFSVPYWYYPK